MFAVGGRRWAIAFGPFEMMGLTIVLAIGGVLYLCLQGVLWVVSQYLSVFTHPEGHFFLHVAAVYLYYYIFVWPFETASYVYDSARYIHGIGAAWKLVGRAGYYSILAGSFSAVAGAAYLSFRLLKSIPKTLLLWISPAVVSLAFMCLQVV